MAECSGWAIALMGAVVGAGLTYIASINVVKQQNFFRSAAVFRSEFTNEINQLQKEEDDVYLIITSAVIARQRKAKVCFEYYLREEKRKKFNSAWGLYENVSVRTKAPGSSDNRHVECNDEIKRINSLLSFADTSSMYWLR